MGYQGLLKTSQPRSRWLRWGLLFACSMVLLGLCEYIGITRAVDQSLQSAYFKVRGKRPSSHSVVLVALDENTVAAWGAPPWSWQHFDSLTTRIAEGAPSLIAMLEHGPGVLPLSAPEPQSRLAQHLRDGLLVLPSSSQGARPGLRIDTGSVESVDLVGRAGMPSLLAQIMARAHLRAPSGSTLAVNYLGPASSLPTVAAHRVASGEIPASTFTNRIVLIGLQGEEFIPLVPTPVGPMSPAEVQAHAITGVMDGVVWAPVPAWLRWTAMALFCALGLLVAPRLSNRLLLIIGGSLMVAFVAADYWLFAAGITRVGISALLFSSVLTTMLAGLMERSQTGRELSDFSRWLLEQSRNDAQARNARGGEDEFLDSFLRASRAFVGYESTLFGVIPPGEHHLDLRILVDTSTEQIFERRRDIRREPYLRAYQSHRPEWSSRVFMNKDLQLKTLMVPLVELGRILGYWIINFRKDAKINRQTMRHIELLADQASIVLERRRLQLQTRPAGKAAPLRSPSMLLAELRESRQTAASFVQAQHRVDELFEQLPVGVLVATLWGDIEQVNAKMRTILKEAGIEDPGQSSLAQLIAKLSGDEEDRVHAELRQVMESEAPLRIGASGTSKGSRDKSPPTTPVLAAYEIILTRISGGGAKDEGANAAAHFVLTASERTAKRGAWLHDVSAPADDVARVVDIMPMTGSGRN